MTRNRSMWNSFKQSYYNRKDKKYNQSSMISIKDYNKRKRDSRHTERILNSRKEKTLSGSKQNSNRPKSNKGNARTIWEMPSCTNRWRKRSTSAKSKTRSRNIMGRKSKIVKKNHNWSRIRCLRMKNKYKKDEESWS